MAEIIDGDFNVIEKADSKVDLPAQLPSRETLASLQEDDPQVKVFPEGNYAAAIIKLANYDNAYLFVAEVLDPRMAGRIAQIQDDFPNSPRCRSAVSLSRSLLPLVYAVIALIATLSAVWIGLHFANYLVAPIRRLISAANLVSTGNLHVQLPIRRSEGDLAHLGETFNKMTAGATHTARRSRARARHDRQSPPFYRSGAGGRSAGVIGVDAEGRVSILNRSAERLIGHAGSRSARQAAGRGRCRSLRICSPPRHRRSQRARADDHQPQR